MEAQLAWAAQAWGQAPLTPSQTKGAQEGIPTVPEGRGEHTPSFPGWLQLSQPPAQAEPQQTPSTQKPLWHSTPEVQVAASARAARHSPSTQLASCWH
ncbi:hypothetical protein [Pyxidicoccus sp. MSG2]|uniref:hypothetical protein n=1 Tax=Pyxidicoccus sp. MSG2 TaxID=2996790 RepID=UPI00226F6787|nr:hypothetical protein [Pyxidicoccus sp. MSG2]MCY1015038.1 hypothetical protein [Pyxidicoccus sp. MSG2]